MAATPHAAPMVGVQSARLGHDKRSRELDEDKVEDWAGSEQVSLHGKNVRWSVRKLVQTKTLTRLRSQRRVRAYGVMDRRLLQDCWERGRSLQMDLACVLQVVGSLTNDSVPLACHA